MPAPLRVGLLVDVLDDPLPPELGLDLEALMRVPIDRLAASGRIDREVELVHAYGLGLPDGTAATIERSFRELVQQDVLLIVGPAVGDNALVATSLADLHRTPTINWAGSERARSAFMFHLQVGSHEDESIVLVRHLVATGHHNVAVLYDRSPIGRRHVQFFQREAERLGLRIASMSSISPLATDVATELSSLLSSSVDAIVYLGLGVPLGAIAAAARDGGWEGTRAMNACGLRGYDPAVATLIDGWTYVDLISDENETLRALREQKETANPFYLAVTHDLGQLVGEGLANAPELTREGVREGLEQVKWLPAAEGHEGTLLGFGHHDRGGLHGRYLVMRTWSGGRSVELAG